MRQDGLLVSEFATNHVISVAPSASLLEAHHTLLARGISSLAVLDDAGHPLGVISRTDLLRAGRVVARRKSGHAVLELPDQTVRMVMTPGVETVTASTPVWQAARAMVERRHHRLFVERDGRLVGVLSTKDLLAAMRASRDATRIDRHMSAPAFSIPASAPLSLAIDRLAQAHVTGLVVVDDSDGAWPIGTFTQLEALEARGLGDDTTVEMAMSYSMLCLPVSTPLFRAAAQAYETRARRVFCIDNRRVLGVMTGHDFARAIGR